MKKGNYFLVLLIITVLGCSSGTKTESMSDSNAVFVPETTYPAEQPPKQIQNQALVSPFSNFLNYSSSLSTDPFESEITFDLEELMASYNNFQFWKVESYYNRERDYEGEYGDQTETEEVTETWYFDKSNKLKAFSSNYYRSGEGRDTKMLICLFSNDSLIALSDYWDEDGQIGMRYHTKILKSSCPECGTDSFSEAGGGDGVRKYLTEIDRVAYEAKYFTTLTGLIGSIGKEWDNATETPDGYSFTLAHDQDSDIATEWKAYSQQFTISKELYNPYVSRRNWLNTFAKNPLKLNSYTSIVNHLKKENIEFSEEIFNGEQQINFGESQIIILENSKDIICSAYIESSSIPLASGIKIGMTEEAFIKAANINKDDIIVDGQRYFEYTLESKSQSRTIQFIFDENVLTAFKVDNSSCMPPDNEK